MKNLSILGIILLTLGILIATGVDQNEAQLFYALMFTGSGTYVLNRCQRLSRQEKNGRTMPIERSEEDAAA